MTIPSAREQDETSPLLAPPAPGGAPSPIPRSAVDLESGGGEANGQDQNNAEIQANQGKKAPNMAIIFPAITIGTFLAAADSTIALVSYATISSELDALNLASWIMTAYVLATASFQPLYGKLCDIFGRKQCLLTAYVIFAAGCLACGLSQSIEQLIAARILQAIGGGGMGTVVSVLLTGLVSPEDRGVWQGVLNIVYALGAGVGAPLGGLLAGTVGWRWSFFSQVPICVLAITMVSLVLESDHDQTKNLALRETIRSKLGRIDFLGSGTLITSISCFMFGLDRGSNVAWTAPESWVSFVISAASMALFFYVEAYVANEPMMPPSITFSPGLLPIYSSSFFVFFSIISLDYILPLYYQAKEQLSPQEASYYMIPAIIAGTSSALLVGFWIKRTGRYYWAILVACFFQGLGGLGVFVSSRPAIDFTGGLVASQVLSEIGVGNTVVSGLLAVIANGSSSSIAIVTAAYYSIRNIGSVLGVSVVATVIQQSLRNILTHDLQGYDLDVRQIVDDVRRSLETLEDLEPEVAAIVRDGYGKAMNRGFLVIFVSALCAWLPALLIRGGRHRRA